VPSTFEEMKRDIETGWDVVLWSESYGWTDAATLTACAFFGCAQAYLGQQLIDLEKKVGKDFLEQVIRNKGQVIVGPGNLEMQFGDAYWSTYYDYWNPITRRREKITTDRYIRLYLRTRRRNSGGTENTISLQNNANTQWKGWYLDIDGNTGNVILWSRLGSGGYWKITEHGDGTVSLQNTANTQWKDWYLDIDGNTGKVILWPRLGSGGYWKITEHGDGTVSLQNNANTQWKDWYLDIDGNTGNVILWSRLGSGGYWKIT